MPDLSSKLTHLPADTVTELEAITQTIIETGKAEIIILFGSYARGDYKTQRGAIQGKKSDYDIFIVVAEYEQRKQLQQALHSAFNDTRHPVQLIIEDIGFVNHKLEEQQYFFSDIKREGKVLFDSGKYQLSNAMELTATRRREIAEADFNQWFDEAKNFQHTANFAVNNKQLRHASFHFQQTVEMCYTAIEMVFAHYNPHEHNLSILRNRAHSFDSRINNAFPLDTSEQQDLFDHLNFAYIGGRYRSDSEFPVNQQQLDYWCCETKKLMDLTQVICNERIQAFIALESK